MNWDAIRTVYLETRSYKLTAERCGVSLNTIKSKARREEWGNDPDSGGASQGANEPPGCGEPSLGGASQGANAPSGCNDAGVQGASQGANAPSGCNDAGVQGASQGANAPSGCNDAGAQGASQGASTKPATVPTIPTNINSLDRLAAARFYADTLNWAIHPLLAPDRGDPQERGKKPIMKGWRNHIAADVTPDLLTKHFGPGTNHNIGCVVRPPFIHVDLDSKPDAGASVMDWLATQPELATVPRERTGGGAHLAFICRDLPEAILKSKQAPTCKINDNVDAELYLNGLNLVLSPSVHKSGHTYRWEVTGDIPEVEWADLCRWFGFSTPESKKPGRPSKEKPWWSKWQENLRTLNLTGILGDLGLLGECLDPDQGKWSVRCPWESRHSGNAVTQAGSDTVVFNPPECLPAFRCLHSHCAERSIKDLVDWLDECKPGIIAANCTGMRAWMPGSKDSKGRPRLILPGTGRSHSEFAAGIGAAIAPTLDMFAFHDSIVELKPDSGVSRPGGVGGDTMKPVDAVEAVTAVERTVETGILAKDDTGEPVFMPKSMSESDARITMRSREFRASLPRITRLLDTPVPHWNDDGALYYPVPGYDPVLRTWLVPTAPNLRSMGLAEALQLLLGELLPFAGEGGFWWRDRQAQTHALARIITPFCRGLMNWRRSPLWIFDGNREGSGKDTCANLAFIIHTGGPENGAPTDKDGDAELRKRITSALLAGSRFFHLANMKGHVNIPCLEAATDNLGRWEDRLLGGNQNRRFNNEMEFSISANNATWEPDIERRCRRISLCATPDDINSHRYRHPQLFDWMLKRRADLLSAVNAMVCHWVRQGCPPGPSPFTSFPEWGAVVGGIFHACGLPDPCLPHEESVVAGDDNTKAMRGFFARAFERFGDDAVLKKDFQAFVQEDEAVHENFPWIDFAARRGLISFGRLIAKYDKRELGGITLNINQTSKNRGDYRFTARGAVADLPAAPSSSPGTPDGRGSGENEPISPTLRIEAKNPDENRGAINRVFTCTYKREGANGSNLPTSPPPVFCSLRSDLDRIAADLAGASRIALDIETYGQRKGDGLDPWKGDIRLLTLSRHGGTIWTIDLRATGYELGPLTPVLEQATLIAHNAKFDLLWLRVKCGLFATKVACTLTAARLLAAGTKPGNNLDQCLERYLQIPPAADHSRSDWASMLLTEDQLAYAARDVAHLHDLLCVLEGELEMNDLQRVWALESELLPVVVKMEAIGIRVDRAKLEAIAAEADKQANQAAADLRTALGNPSLNPASPGQVLAALRAKGISLESTAEEALKAADDGTIIPLVLAHREASKRAQQAEALVGHIKSDGRIHGRFEPLGTATGRFSSKEPNLQNIGRGDLREAFAVQDGRRLVVADYSQIELRAAAAIAGETRMIDAYKSGADLHKRTAASILGKPEDQVTKADRQLAKAAGFGNLYGQSAPGLVRYAATSYGVTMTGDQATEIRQAFFRTYSRLRQWHGLSHNQAETGITEVRTRTGRRRLIPTTATDWERFTALVNTPVQGGTADGMKQALILIDQRLPQSARIVSTVHDEVVVECHDDTAEQCREIITTAMVEAMAALFPEVPVEVEANICTTWAEK